MTNDIRKYMDIVESELSQGDIRGVFRKAAAPSNTVRGKLFNRKGITYDELMDMWSDEQYTNDSKEIIKLLKDAGFGRVSIANAFQLSKVSKKGKSDPKIERLAGVIKKYKLEQPIMQFLGKHFKIKESLIYEKTLSDKDIKKVFVKMVNAKPEGGKVDTKYIDDISSKILRNADELPAGFTVDTEDGTYTWKGAQWVHKGRIVKREMQAKLQELATEKNNKAKEPLLKELVDYIADRHGHPEWEELSTRAQALIKQADLPTDITGTAMGSLRRGQYYGDIQESRIINATHLQLEEMFAKLVNKTTYGRGKKHDSTARHSTY